MKRLKIFPKTFLYTLGLMVFMNVMAHTLFYLLTPPVSFTAKEYTNDPVLTAVTLNLSDYIAGIIRSVLPISMLICFIVSVLCSLLFSRAMTRPIRRISAETAQMETLDRNARCIVQSDDEIGALANNVNRLYHSLLKTIENLEIEKIKVSESEKSKVDFLRMASHELKTPVTALNAMLENMMLGVGKYKDHEVYLPKCKRMTEQLAEMIKNVLDTSNLSVLVRDEATADIHLPAFLTELCEPFQIIAKAKGIRFELDVTEGGTVHQPPELFGKALNNLVSNAVSYTQRGHSVMVYCDADHLVIENECDPIPEEHLKELFKPFYRPEYERGRDTGGNGLGLYIVDSILNALRISYTFTPTPSKKGMAFSLLIKK
ncbi:hypothetical protein J25TS5_15720 [Paenibacillus faecis]|uniref:sensor histidine kinase n=1 Tax=Paenibacillus faecis TaxID=862114 RepID=UPI001B144E3A|nr:HAMP domain-containing sensor histidine kinase [Paenibacillus faecis]GIO84640.1 hypothetical protein J25TS5_15720 [Paenibacillus faecis]